MEARAIIEDWRRDYNGTPPMPPLIADGATDFAVLTARPKLVSEAI